MTGCDTVDSASNRFRGTVKKGGRQNDLQAAKGDLAGVVPPARACNLQVVGAPAHPDGMRLTHA
jgi:hypothetical protein